MCIVHDRYFGAGELRTLPCVKPLKGRFLVFYIHSEAVYLTLCEIMVFGDRGTYSKMFSVAMWLYSGYNLYSVSTTIL